MNLEQIKKKFPSALPLDKLPTGAKEMEIEVYRLCTTGAVEPNSFLPTFLDPAQKDSKNIDHNNISYYSLSTFEGENDILRIYKFFKQKRNPKTIIAKGATATSCGIVQRTAERTGQITSHVDWWLYENAEPHRFFQPYESV